ESCDRAHAQPTDVDPGSRREFEVFCHAAIEYEPTFGMPVVREADRITYQVEAFFVEVSRGQVRATPVPWCNQRAAHSNFVLSVARQQFQLAAGYRQADHPGSVSL